MTLGLQVCLRESMKGARSCLVARPLSQESASAVNAGVNFHLKFGAAFGTAILSAVCVQLVLALGSLTDWTGCVQSATALNPFYGACPVQHKGTVPVSSQFIHQVILVLRMVQVLCLAIMACVAVAQVCCSSRASSKRGSDAKLERMGSQWIAIVCIGLFVVDSTSITLLPGLVLAIVSRRGTHRELRHARALASAVVQIQEAATLQAQASNFLRMYYMGSYGGMAPAQGAGHCAEDTPAMLGAAGVLPLGDNSAKDSQQQLCPARSTTDHDTNPIDAWSTVAARHETTGDSLRGLSAPILGAQKRTCACKRCTGEEASDSALESKQISAGILPPIERSAVPALPAIAAPPHGNMPPSAPRSTRQSRLVATSRSLPPDLCHRGDAVGSLLHVRRTEARAAVGNARQQSHRPAAQQPKQTLKALLIVPAEIAEESSSSLSLQAASIERFAKLLVPDSALCHHSAHHAWQVQRLLTQLLWSNLRACTILSNTRHVWASDTPLCCARRTTPLLELLSGLAVEAGEVAATHNCDLRLELPPVADTASAVLADIMLVDAAVWLRAAVHQAAHDTVLYKQPVGLGSQDTSIYVVIEVQSAVKDVDSAPNVDQASRSRAAARRVAPAPQAMITQQPGPREQGGYLRLGLHVQQRTRGITEADVRCLAQEPLPGSGSPRWQALLAASQALRRPTTDGGSKCSQLLITGSVVSQNAQNGINGWGGWYSLSASFEVPFAPQGTEADVTSSAGAGSAEGTQSHGSQRKPDTCTCSTQHVNFGDASSVHVDLLAPPLSQAHGALRLAARAAAFMFDCAPLACTTAPGVTAHRLNCGFVQSQSVMTRGNSLQQQGSPQAKTGSPQSKHCATPGTHSIPHPLATDVSQHHEHYNKAPDGVSGPRAALQRHQQRSDGHDTAAPAPPSSAVHSTSTSDAPLHAQHVQSWPVAAATAGPGLEDLLRWRRAASLGRPPSLHRFSTGAGPVILEAPVGDSMGSSAAEAHEWEPCGR